MKTLINDTRSGAKAKRMSWLKEPMVQFVLIGLLTFSANTWWNSSNNQEDKTIRVSESELSRIRSLYTKQWGSPPSAQQLQDLLQNHIREEVLYREALSQGLQEDDVVVRRRLVQKMEFLLANAVQNPTVEQLLAYYQARPEEFKSPARLSFEHVFFSRAQRGEHALKDAQSALKVLQAGGRDAHKSLGDKIELPSSVDNYPADKLTRDWGQGFSNALTQSQPEAWSGPIESPFGWHVVRLRQLIPEQILPFEQVRESISIKVAQQSMKSLTQTNTQHLINTYQIELPPTVSALADAASQHGGRP